MCIKNLAEKVPLYVIIGLGHVYFKGHYPHFSFLLVKIMHNLVGHDNVITHTTIWKECWLPRRNNALEKRFQPIHQDFCDNFIDQVIEGNWSEAYNLRLFRSFGDKGYESIVHSCWNNTSFEERLYSNNYISINLILVSFIKNWGHAIRIETFAHFESKNNSFDLIPIWYCWNMSLSEAVTEGVMRFYRPWGKFGLLDLNKVEKYCIKPSPIPFHSSI